MAELWQDLDKIYKQIGKAKLKPRSRDVGKNGDTEDVYNVVAPYAEILGLLKGGVRELQDELLKRPKSDVLNETGHSAKEAAMALGKAEQWLVAAYEDLENFLE